MCSLPAKRVLAREILVLEQCQSTHQLLRQRVDEDGAASPQSPPSLLMLAESQIFGKGRRRPDWWSGPPRCNIAASLLLEPVQPPETLGLHAACAVADALNPLLEAPQALPQASGPRPAVALKWPNDILLNGSKVGGVLVEVSERHGQPFAILSLGLNFLVAPPVDAAPYPTTAVADHAGIAGQGHGHQTRAVDRTRFLTAWLWALEKRLAWARVNGHLQLEQSFLPLLKHWAPYGVLDPITGDAGPLVEFSVQRGLTWGLKGSTKTRPLGWIPALEALPAPHS